MQRRIASLLYCFSVSLFFVTSLGCAALQGYHYYDEDAGYPAHPGNGSAQVSYMATGGPGYGRVNGTTTMPERAIETIARAQVLDAQAEAIHECVKNGNCAMFPYGGRYSRSGYTLSGIQAVEAWKSKDDKTANAGNEQLNRIEKGIRHIGRLQLEQGRVIEKNTQGNDGKEPSEQVK